MKKEAVHIASDFLLTILFLALSTLLGIIFRQWGFHKTNIVVIYNFSVLLIARYTKGYAFGVGASAAALLLFNWFFTEPYYTLKVNDTTYLFTFGIMMFTSVFTSTLTTKVKKAAQDAKLREEEKSALYRMTNRLTRAENTEEIQEITVNTVSNVLGCNAACLLFDAKGEPEKTFIQQKSDGSVIRRDLQNGAEFKRNMEKAQGITEYGALGRVYPVYGKTMIIAVLFVPNDTDREMNESKRGMLNSAIESASLALERLRSLQEQARTREEATQERYRGNLLRAISHDLRTPLSGIMGTSEMLMDATETADMRYDLAKDIYRDAEWLHALVENILNLTKLNDGKMTMNKQPEVLEEVIGAAVTVMEKRLPDRVIDVEVPDEVLMVPMDAKLISQVLINLLDNAAKHTPQEGEISISVKKENELVHVTVADRGSGIPADDLPHVFQMFYTGKSKRPDAKRGVGLGLSICQSVAEAHGGSIFAENRPGGGAAITFTLPTGGEKVDAFQ